MTLIKGTRVQKGQIWLDPRTHTQYIVHSKKGDGWRMNILTDKPGVYNGRHTFHKWTFKKLTLLK